jgi:predicted DsbA family dithiol-disulfide isomerase
MIEIDVWSDFLCPWCYLGKRRLDRAIEETGTAEATVVGWRSFQLDPDVPRFGSPGAGEPSDRRLLRKYGDPERIRVMMERVTALAAEDGLRYRLPTAPSVHTVDAHRLTHEAAEHDRADELVEALFHAQLVANERIDDPAVLTAIATRCGLPRERVTEVLETGIHLDAVQRDIEAAYSIGVRGVPFFIVDRRFALSGAQPVETFVAALSGDLRAAG